MRKTPIYLFLILLAAFVFVPFLWMIITSLKPSFEVMTKIPIWIPQPIRFSNYGKALSSSPFATYFLNSFLISMLETIFDLTFGAMAAYAFARIDFYGRKVLFLVFLATMMVPGEMMLVPNFITISGWGWTNTYQGLIVPWLISVFTIFLMRQFFLGLPQELFDAAELDGCSHFRILFQIIFPLAKPIWITAGLIKFVGSWNSFLWVLIVANSSSLYTVPVGLLNFTSDFDTVYNQMMAAATCSLLPLVILFLFGQRYFIEGISRTGLR